jgi:hypothetical protein
LLKTGASIQIAESAKSPEFSFEMVRVVGWIYADTALVGVL